jgi:predicted deacetylase
MQLDIKFTLKFTTCISKREAMKYFLNPTTNMTADKSKALLRAELKGTSGALQMIAYRRPSGSTALQCILLQSHFYGLNINYSSCWVKHSTTVFSKIKLISLHLSNKCKKLNKFLEANTNYIDTLQFEMNTHRPTPYGM